MGSQTAIEELLKEAVEVKELLSEKRANNSGNIIQFHGSAPGWTMANALIAMSCLGMVGIMSAMLWGMNERIGDLKDQINADSVKLEAYKVSNEERARTDRLLHGTLKDRVTKLEAAP